MRVPGPGPEFLFCGVDLMHPTTLAYHRPEPVELPYRVVHTCGLTEIHSNGACYFVEYEPPGSSNNGFQARSTSQGHGACTACG